MHTLDTFKHAVLQETRSIVGSAGYQNKELGISQAIVWSVNRDSGLIDESNWESVVAGCQNLDPEGDNWSIERFRHWAIGWIDYLILSVDCANEVQPDEFGPDHLQVEILRFIEDCQLRIENYPVLDEHDHSAREYNEAIEMIEDELKVLGADPERASDVFSMLDDTPRRNDGLWHEIERAAYELGIIPEDDTED